MTVFSVEIETVNAAYEDGNAPSELAANLRTIVSHLERGEIGGLVRDSNGGRVGQWSLELE